jgi:hypothetical protein
MTYPSEDDFSDWVNKRFSDLAEEFADKNEEKFDEFCWEKFEKFRQNYDDIVNEEKEEDYREKHQGEKE